MKSRSCLFLLSLLLASCVPSPKEKISTKANEAVKAKEEPFVLISPDGDTIPTGIPIPVKGKWIDPDSVAKPKTIPLRGKPKVVPAHPNVHPAGTPKTVPISKELTVITPGKDGVPLPETVPARGKVVPAGQPEPIPALAPRFKDAAKYDIQYLDVDQGMISSYVYSMLEDSQGNLWFATQEGVSRYDGHSFTHYTTGEGLSDNPVHSMLEDSQGDLWFGTYGGGVSRYDGQRFTHYTTEEGLSDNWVHSMLEDSQGDLWFGTQNGGMSRYDPASGESGTFTHYTTEEGLSRNHVWSVLEDSQGNLWFGTMGGGVSRYDPTLGESGTFTRYTREECLIYYNVVVMLEDSRGHLWFGTGGGGVSRYDPALGENGTFTHYTTEEGLSDNLVHSMLEDSQGDLWFGTQSGGVSHYDPALGESGTFTHYTTEEGLSNNWVWSMVEDKKKNIWMATQKGITLSIPHSSGPSMNSNSETEDYSEGTPLGQFFTFGKLDGLKRIDFEKSTLLDRQNRLWWGSGNGLTMLDLEQFELPTEPPKSIQLTHIEIGQQFVDYRRLADTSYKNNFSFGNALSQSFDSVAPFYNYPLHMTLPHHLNHLTFHFSAIDWAAPHKVRFSYLMEGLDEDWSPPTAELNADYRNLPYGTFTFKLKAIGAAQIWSEPFEYTFTIRPPWWFTWWAYTLYGLLITGLLYALYRFLLNRQLQLAETHRLRELDQVKTRLYTNITHEFRTPLTIILGMADKVADNPKEWLSKGTGMIRRNGRNLLRLVNQMLDLSKLESGKLELEMVQGNVVSYLRYVMESFHSLVEAKNISLHFSSEKEILIMDYDPDKLLTIVSNLLSNAVKFTPEGGEVFFQLAVGSMQLAGDQLPTAHRKSALPARRRHDQTVPYRAGRASIRADQVPTEDWLLLTVRDTGIGIPKDKLPHIFHRFYQADDSSTRIGEGTGIGLTLTRELVKLMGGQVEVESRVDQGTEFRIVLPMHRRAPMVAEVRKPSIAEEVKAFASPFGPKQVDTTPARTSGGDLPVVLIVEDNADVVKYLISCLEGDYQLKVAYDGQAGIDEALKTVPDIIISDVMMPEKDGFELCRTLKTDERTSHIPIILLTARADVDSRLEGLEEGADAYLAKPFHPGELLLRVRKLLELRANLRAHYLALAGGGGQRNPQALSPSEVREQQFVAKVRKAVEDHLANPDLSVEILCREIAMSRSQLHRKLKALTGYSTTQFVRYIRLSKARQLLKDTDLSISEVAYDTGFTDPGYFSRVFR